MSSDPKNKTFFRVSLIIENKNVSIFRLNIFKMWDLGNDLAKHSLVVNVNLRSRACGIWGSSFDSSEWSN